MPEQKWKALHQQLSWMGKVERMLYSLPYTYHLLDMERNNCWIKAESHIPVGSVWRGCRTPYMIMLTMMKHQTLIATHSEENMRQPFSGYWLLESAAATRTSATMASRRDLAQGLLGL